MKNQIQTIPSRCRRTVSAALCGFLPGLLLFLAGSDSLRAANDTWTGGNNPDFNWNTNANWSPASAPVANDLLFFAGPVGLQNTNNFVSNTNFGGITFNSGAGLFTLVGNAFTLANGGGITNNSASPQTNRITTLNVNANNLTNYITTPGGGPLVLTGGFRWADSASAGNIGLTNDALFINGANLILGGQQTIGEDNAVTTNNAFNNLMYFTGSTINGGNQRFN
jgi:hypothetical protein